MWTTKTGCRNQSRGAKLKCPYSRWNFFLGMTFKQQTAQVSTRLLEANMLQITRIACYATITLLQNTYMYTWYIHSRDFFFFLVFCFIYRIANFFLLKWLRGKTWINNKYTVTTQRMKVYPTTYNVIQWITTCTWCNSSITWSSSFL